jgi:hypothetical protein
LKQRFARSLPVPLGIVLAVGAIASLVLVPTAAAAELGPANTVYIKAGKGGLHFEAPKTIANGAELEVVNKTNPKQVGPHTFSLVTKGSIPKTPKQRQLCFTPHHICKAIADWHGVKGEGPPSKNPAEAGEEGWDTLGSLTKKGDSWFTGTKPKASIVQKVTAAAGTTIYFMCAIHPWMHGSIKVTAPVPAPLPVG